MNDPIISANGLSKLFGPTKVVDDLNFDIARGEFFGLLGPNGAGKTTTIGLLTGLIPPSSGEITIDGLSLEHNPRRVKGKIGFVPQEFAFYPDLTAKDNLYFWGRLYGLGGRRLRQRSDDVLRMMGLLDYTGKAVRTFSGGMKRRLNIAIGLLHEPMVLMLDEPTMGVDTRMRRVILDYLGDLNSAGLTVLYSTHIMEEAQRLCHRVAIMDLGKLVALNTPSALIRRSGKRTIRINTHQPIDRSQLEAVNRFGSIILQDDHVAQIQLNDETADMGEVLACLNKAIAEIKSLEILEPSLETAFLGLVGRPATETVGDEMQARS